MAGDRISIFAAGREFVLAELTDTVQEGTDVEPDGEFQVVRYLFGTAATVIDRRNELVTLTFTVGREYRNEVQAWDKWVNCRNNTPRAGNLSWLARGSTSRLTRYVVGCVLRVRPVLRSGSYVRLQYNVIGGQVTTQPPNNA